MSTKMSEDDFVNAVSVFRACLPRSGAKGRDDRLFLEGCTISRFTTSRGGLCRSALACGTASGSASTG
jgi:hypothetical protein